MEAPSRMSQLWEWFTDINPFHALLVIAALPVAILCCLVGMSVVVLAISDPGFAQLMLFTIILGMLFGLPEVLGL
ncbi:MAG: hypothetical protein Fur005_24190 [Roseiflexaceae bacterium]